MALRNYFGYLVVLSTKWGGIKMNYAIPWDFRVTLDLFLGGIGVGSFLTAILVSYINPRNYSGLIKKGIFIAPVAIGIGVIFLLSELGRPERFLTTLFKFNPSSVMSWGAFLQVVFVLIALILAWQIYQGKTLGGSLRWIGAIFALAVGLYHGVLLSSSGSNPLWNDSIVPIMFLVSSLLAGCSLVLLLHSFGAIAGTNTQAEVAATVEKVGSFDFRKLLLGLLVFQLIAVLLWMFSLARTDLYTSEALQLFLASQGTLWWLGAIGLGLVIPLVLVLSSLLQKTREISGGIMSIITFSILVGGFVFKQLILIIGQIKFPVF